MVKEFLPFLYDEGAIWKPGELFYDEENNIAIEIVNQTKEKIIPCFYRSIRKDKIKWGSKKFRKLKKSNKSMQNCTYF